MLGHNYYWAYCTMYITYPTTDHVTDRQLYTRWSCMELDLSIKIIGFKVEFLFFTFSSEKALDLCKMWSPPPPFLSNVHVLRPSQPEKIEKSIFLPNYARYEKMLTSKIIHHKETYKFSFDHFFWKNARFLF